jgi:hypothetical protein
MFILTISTIKELRCEKGEGREDIPQMRQSKKKKGYLRIQVKSPDARSDCDERHRSRVVYHTAKIFEDSHKT